MSNSPEAMTRTMIDNMKEKTGKTLQQWITIVKKTNAIKHGEILKILKSEHGMTHGFANLVALKTLKSDAASADTDLVAEQYAGAKAGLKPIYEALIKAATSFGDVEVAAKKSYVSLRRSKQFAIIQPSTRTRVDLGLNLKDVLAKGRLEKSGSFNAMVSHRVRLETAADVDKDVTVWMEKAFSSA